MKRRSFVMAAIVAAGFLLGTAGQSQASVILISESQLSATDQVLSAPGPDGTRFPNPLVIPYDGGTASFNGPGGFVQRNTETGNSPTRRFALGDPIFTTSDSPLELLFSSDVTEVGTQFVNGVSGPFRATISAYDANNRFISAFSSLSDSTIFTGGNPENTAAFLGLRTTVNEPAIRRVLFQTSPVFTANIGPNPFSINQVSFGSNTAAPFVPAPAPVPEPSTYAMFGLGLVAVVALQRRKRKSSPHSAPAFSAAC